MRYDCGVQVLGVKQLGLENLPSLTLISILSYLSSLSRRSPQNTNKLEETLNSCIPQDYRRRRRNSHLNKIGENVTFKFSV